VQAAQKRMAETCCWASSAGHHLPSCAFDPFGIPCR